MLASEPIPEVDPNQMKAYWDIYDKEKDVAYAASAWHLSPGAVYGKPLVYRCWMLKLLESVPVEAMPQLASIKENGRLIDAAVRVGARFPMKWMKMGKQELPYDRAAFIEEVRKESGGV